MFRFIKYLFVALAPLACFAQDTNPPDIHLQWGAAPFATGYRVYWAKTHPGTNTLPAPQGYIDCVDTNCVIPYAPPYLTAWWVICTNTQGLTSKASNWILNTNGYEFTSVTVTCYGTGDVFQCSQLLSPPFWLQTRTNSSGIIGSWTNPVVNQFFKGPQMGIAQLNWNQ